MAQCSVASENAGNACISLNCPHTMVPLPLCCVLCALSCVQPALSTVLCAVCIRLPLSPVYDPDEKFSNYLMLLEFKSKTKAFFSTIMYQSYWSNINDTVG